MGERERERRGGRHACMPRMGRLLRWKIAVFALPVPFSNKRIIVEMASRPAGRPARESTLLDAPTPAEQ